MTFLKRNSELLSPEQRDGIGRSRLGGGKNESERFPLVILRSDSHIRHLLLQLERIHPDGLAFPSSQK